MPATRAWFYTFAQARRARSDKFKSRPAPGVQSVGVGRARPSADRSGVGVGAVGVGRTAADLASAVAESRGRIGSAGGGGVGPTVYRPRPLPTL